MFLLLAADDLPWLPCAGPGLHGHLDLTYLQYLQEPVRPGQHLLAVDLTDLLNVQVHVHHHVVAADQEPVRPGQHLLADHLTDPTHPLLHLQPVQRLLPAGCLCSCLLVLWAGYQRGRG